MDRRLALAKDGTKTPTRKENKPGFNGGFATTSTGTGNDPINTPRYETGEIPHLTCQSSHFIPSTSIETQTPGKKKT